MAEPVFLEPASTTLTDQHASNRIDTAPNPFASNHDVWLDTVFGARPDLTAPHQSGLNLIRDIQCVITFTELLYSRKVALMRHGESISRRDRFHDDSGHIAAAKRIFHCIKIIKRDLDEFSLGVFRKKQFGETIIAGFNRESRVAVIGLDNRDNLALLRSVTCGLQGNIDRLTPSGAIGGVTHIR